MRVKLDKTICDGFGPCAAHAPDIFTRDDWGYAAAANGKVIDPRHENGVRRAILDCPVHAITELPTHEFSPSLNVQDDSMSSQQSWTRTWDSTIDGWSRFAAVNDEFFTEHSIPDKAKQLGLPGAVGMGNLRFQYQNTLLDCCVPPALRVARYECRLTELDIIGDRLTAWAEPEPCYELSSEVSVLLGVRNQRGEECAPGRALLVPAGDTKCIEPAAPTPGDDVAARQLGIGDWLDRWTEPIVSWPISPNDIRRWRIAIAWSARDVAVDWANSLSVPRLYNPFAWNASYLPAEFPWMPPVGEAVGSRVLNGGIDVQFSTDMKIDDVITCTARLLNCRTRTGRLGEMLILTDEQVWTNLDGVLVNRIIRSTIYY